MADKQQARTGGQLVVDQLLIHGVQQIFTVPGESFLAVLDALYDAPIETTICRQEGGAAMMAEAQGKLTGQPGICMVTRGPGATNASAGLHIAMQDSTPMILFVGQIERSARGREAFQELDYRAVFGPMVKWATEKQKKLDKKGVAYEEYDLTMGGPKRTEMLERVPGATTVPQILIDDKPFGGFDDINALDREGKLDPVIGRDEDEARLRERQLGQHAAHRAFHLLAARLDLIDEFARAAGQGVDVAHQQLALAHQVHQAVVFGHVQLHLGVAVGKVTQVGHHKVARQRALQVDPQQALRRRVAKGAFRLLQIGQHALAALIELAALWRQLHPARTAQQQLRAQPRLHARHDLAGGRRRHAQVAGSSREAAVFGHLHKHLQLAGAVGLKGRAGGKGGVAHGQKRHGGRW